jgi:2-pyrone-4,6-dicarboxylate lactonase
LALPQGAWDSQVHVFGETYPLRPQRAYDPPPNSDVGAMLQMHQRLGFEFGVVVQASAQGFDTRHITEVLRRVPHYAGVVLMHDRISYQELTDLHAAGVRGARFVFLPGLGVRPDYRSLKRALPMLRELGWFAKIFATANDWTELKPHLENANLPIMIDHLGYVDPSAGLQQPAMNVILSLLERDNVWMMLSCADRVSKVPDWSDVVPYAKAFIRAAPDRVVWGSDWPHAAYEHSRPSNEAVFEMLSRYTEDEAELQRILSSNPTRFFRR